MLKSGANVLLLIEPTNDLDVDTLRALEEDAFLDFPGCCRDSHDRWFLDRIATHILALKEIAMRSGSRAISQITRLIKSAALAQRQSVRSASAISLFTAELSFDT